MKASTNSETDTLIENCVSEYKHQIDKKTSSVICKTCRELYSETLSQLPEYSKLIENRSDQKCMCKIYFLINQNRNKTGCRKMSRTQVSEIMLDLLSCQQQSNDKLK